ncbi:hypothetical protein RhiTH_007628 [Rhizoctonia solani]
MASQVGTTQDMNTQKHKHRKDNDKYHKKISQARDLIYTQGRLVQSKAVEDLLKEESYVPTQNAFSRLGGQQEFNVFSSLVVDQLHKVELGVWKTLFKHLVQLLHLGGNNVVLEFNKRMGRIAARDFEDILQCSIPAFEGLLPESCDRPAQQLLFIFAQWHGMAKLRLHTKSTLGIFKSLTIKLASALRAFSDLTKSLDVRETPQEYARRKKRQEAAKAVAMTRIHQETPTRQTISHSGDGRRICSLNLNTYKFHALGDYVRTIEEFGTTDSYSTQIGELQGRRFKAQYSRTNKQDAVTQMTRIDDITSVLREMEGALTALQKASTNQPPIDEGAMDSLLDGEPYFIGLKDRSEDMIPNVSLWVSQNSHDISTRFFLPQLKRHLLARVLGDSNHPEFCNSNILKVRLAQERMYRHNTLRVNYTSYDILRQQDSLSPTSHQCFALLPTKADRHPDEHPFVYAKILGVYHAKVLYDRRPPKRYEFIHVRWLYYDYDRPGGWEHHKLDRLHYQMCRNDQDILDAFDFIDPKDILRATHLIPDFQAGKTPEYIPRFHSFAHDHTEGTDWSAYYVNRFVDRDMLMHYIGGGIGHYQPTPSETTVGSNDESDGEEQADNDDEDELGDEDKDGNGADEDQGKAPESERTEDTINQEDVDVIEFDGEPSDEDMDDEAESVLEGDDEIDDEIEF